MHSGQHGSGRIIKYAHSSTSPSQLLTPVTGSLALSPQKHSLSAVCGRYCPTASRGPRANPSRARQWTLPLSTTAPARATRSRRSQLHRGEPRRLSSKGSAHDHQRLPYRMVPRRSVSDQRGPTPFTRRRSWRLFNVPRLRGGTLDPGWLRTVTARTRISVADVEATGLSKSRARVRAEKFTRHVAARRASRSWSE
jgi:hypothetical protein